MTSPSQVLDHKMALHDHLLAPAYRFYMQNFLDDMAVKENGSLVTDEKGQPSAWHWVRREQNTIHLADAYYVSPDMLTVARHASAGLDGTDRFDRDLWPSDYGFMWLDGGLVSKEAWGRTVVIQAISWRRFGPNESREQGTGRSIGTGGYSLTFYTDLDDPRDEVSADIRKHIIETSPTSARRYAEMGALHVNHLSAIYDGQRVGPEEYVPPQQMAAYAAGDLELTSSVPNDSRVLLALLMLLNQTLVSVTEEEPERPVARRARRMKMPARVTVIRLRRHKDANRYEGETMVEWAHRWVVTGHWRWQPYGGRTLAHEHTYGPVHYEVGRKICYCTIEGCESRVERIYIDPYWKGPEGAPIKQSEKVYSLVR